MLIDTPDPRYRRDPFWGRRPGFRVWLLLVAAAVGVVIGHYQAPLLGPLPVVIPFWVVLGAAHAFWLRDDSEEDEP